MKKIIFVVSICLCAVVVLLGCGGYAVAVASNRLVPIYKVDTDKIQASISFDAAWGADKTTKILDLCDQYGVKATFFLVGFWIDEYPDLVLEIHNRGHEIGTHSTTHPKMSQLSEDEIRKELKGSMAAITAITGQSVTLFRPPFGDYNNTLIEVATSLGLHTIQWSIDTLDWKGISGVEIANRCQRAEAGDIILSHNNSDHIVDALPLIFVAIDNKAIELVPIGKLIFTENYTIDNNGVQHKNTEN